MNFTIQADPEQVRALEAMLSNVKNGVPRVLVRALNKIGTWVHAELVRTISGAVQLQPSKVRKAIRLSKARFARLVAYVRIYNKSMPLIWFHARQTAKGVSFTAPAGADWALDYKAGRKGRLFVPHAFIATMPGGHVGVFLRRGDARLPIEELKGPSPLSVFTGVVGLSQKLIATAGERLEAEVKVQTQVLLDQEAAKGPLQSRAARTAALLRGYEAPEVLVRKPAA
jgi:hypothetical protein